jgi:hypothetical protein
VRSRLIQSAGLTAAALTGFGFGLLIVVVGLVAWLLLKEPPIPPLESRVDTSLQEDGAWPLGRTNLKGEEWCEVHIGRVQSDSIEVCVTNHWNGYYHEMRLVLAFQPQGAPQVSAAGETHDVHNSDWRGTDGKVGGVVLVSSDHLPSARDARLIVSYDLVADDGGSQGHRPGKFVLRAEDLR